MKINHWKIKPLIEEIISVNGFNLKESIRF
jgi:hypothetical protein